MKRLVLLLVLAVLSLNLVCAGWDYPPGSPRDYASIPPKSLPVFTGSFDDPSVQVVYYSQDGLYVYVIYEGVLHVFYL
jgi:hypothetical protein